MIRVLCAHEAPIIGELVVNVLKAEPDIEIVGYAATAEETLGYLDNCECDIIIADINLPKQGAMHILQELQNRERWTKVLITGLAPSSAAILHCLEEGAAGYVDEAESLAELVKKLRFLHENEFNLTPEITGVIIERIAELKQLTKELAGLDASQTPAHKPELTSREWEVLSMIEQGLTNQEIAEALTIELGTVKNHVHNILTKLDVCSREHAALFASQMFTSSH